MQVDAITPDGDGAGDGGHEQVATDTLTVPSRVGGEEADIRRRGIVRLRQE